MVKSPIKFDDLAFILLFFFMIIAVISFSNSMKIETSNSSQTEDIQSVSIFLDENGVLTRDGNPVSCNDFSKTDVVDLSCAENASWAVISSAIQNISNTGASVSLVVK